MISSKRPRAGFTLIELLVVIAIIAVLIGLLVPAVQQVREAANRSTCKNNLKQIGIALHLYHDQKKVFPPGTDNNNYAWSFHTLPFLEQSPIYNQVNPKVNKLTAVAGNLVVLQSPLSIFLCPTDDGGPLNRNRPFNSLTGPTLAMSNYPGNGGNAPGTGIFALNSTVKITDIRDGTSNTFLAGERATLTIGFTGTGAAPNKNYAALWAGWDSSGYTAAPTESVWGYTQVRMFDGNGPTLGNQPLQAFSSAHVGGAHFLLCDGSVRFVMMDVPWNSTTAAGSTPQVFATYNSLGDKNDGNSVGDF